MKKQGVKKIILIVLSVFGMQVCFSQNQSALMEIVNTKENVIYVEIWGFPAENYENNKAGAFDKKIAKDESFILKLENDLISPMAKGYEANPTAALEEYEGFEILIYEPLEDDLVIFGDTPKDTLLHKKVLISELIKDKKIFRIEE